MYEKHGLMSKLTNPEVLAYLRRHRETSHTRLIEAALRKHLGLEPKKYGAEHRGRHKVLACVNALPVKVRDPYLVNYLVTNRRENGVCHRHVLEKAILAMVGEEAQGE